MFTDAPGGSDNVPLTNWNMGNGSTSVANLVSFLDGSVVAAAWPQYGLPVRTASELDAYVTASQKFIADHSTPNMPSPCTGYGNSNNGPLEVRWSS